MAEKDTDNESGESYEYQPEPENGNGGRTLGPSAPAVANASGKMFIVALLGIAAIGIIGYSLFSGEEVAPPPVQTEKATVATPSLPPEAPDFTDTVPLPPPDQLPTQVTTDPIAPPPLPPIEPPADISAQAPTNEELLKRRMSNMMLKDGGDAAARKADAPTVSSKLAKTPGGDPNTAFASTVENTEADQAVATRMGNLNYMIAQGKMITAVLETAINSDLPGQIRAIVSRDTFAESGREVLIPKGSRVIGTYNTSVLRGQKRVYIVWTRIIRPDGIDIMVDSPGTDQLGRAGMGGHVDNKYMEAYSGAFLTSMISFAIAFAGDEAMGENNQVTSTTSSDGSTTTTGSAGARALTDTVGNLGDVTDKVVGDLLDLRPTITVDQGTRVNVFVNKDLIFPAELLQQTRFIH